MKNKLLLILSCLMGFTNAGSRDGVGEMSASNSELKTAAEVINRYGVVETELSQRKGFIGSLCGWMSSMFPKKAVKIVSPEEKERAQKIADQIIIQFISSLDSTEVSSFTYFDEASHTVYKPETLKEVYKSKEPEARLLSIGASLIGLFTRIYWGHYFQENFKTTSKSCINRLQEELKVYGPFFDKFMNYLQNNIYENDWSYGHAFLCQRKTFEFIDIEWTDDIPQYYQRIAIAYSLVLELVYDEKYKELRESTVYKKTLSMLKEYMDMVVDIEKNNRLWYKTWYNPDISSVTFEDEIKYRIKKSWLRWHSIDYSETDAKNRMKKGVIQYNQNLGKIAKKYTPASSRLKVNIRSFSDLQRCVAILNKEIENALNRA